jgi:hypothetical protein
MLRQATPQCTISEKFPKGRHIEVYKPGDTRFATNFRMILRTLELQQAMQQVTFSKDYADRCAVRREQCPVAELVGDRNFWLSMKGWVDVLWPTYELLRELDTPDPALHVVYEGGLAVQQAYANSNFPHSQQLGELWKADWAYMHVPAHSAAYVLHPRYQKEPMQENTDVWPEFLDVCTTMLGEAAGSMAVEQFNLYQEGKGLFGSGMAQQSATRMAPHSWWKSYGAATPQLQQLAMKLLSQPASAAAAEQSWSEYDFVHSKKRNRLKSSVASKLVYVHSNMRLLSRHSSYSRHEEMLDAAVRASSLADSLLTDGWDGNCSDDDIELTQLSNPIVIPHEAEPPPQPSEIPDGPSIPLLLNPDGSLELVDI